ncbi:MULTISPECIES: hypothetical protein [Haloarcula]|uniref:Uncharacterized protein n=2 Tax=Haloarcula TaxID=2237 RepID=A0A495R7K9_9EURY|nr:MULTISPECIES: hypothetical protein [Haloarcula]NLV11901.1 hypothetical protein [Haloarcula argentinensis]RKS83291.1 hypothetical protein BDK61_2634 [Haloarcula quadrata]
MSGRSTSGDPLDGTVQSITERPELDDTGESDDVHLTTMQCPVDGTQLSNRYRDDNRVECPACRGRFDVAEVIVDA